MLSKPFLWRCRLEISPGREEELSRVRVGVASILKMTRIIVSSWATSWFVSAQMINLDALRLLINAARVSRVSVHRVVL